MGHSEDPARGREKGESSVGVRGTREDGAAETVARPVFETTGGLPAARSAGSTSGGDGTSRRVHVVSGGVGVPSAARVHVVSGSGPATTAPAERLDATRSSVSGVGSDEVDAAAGLSGLARGSLIGRYVVLDRLGAGAMGVVFAAIDPELDRKVAIKLLQSDGAGVSLRATSEARARMVREAQALAKLSHPNVVAVFDAGTHEEQVWIAMELVEGRTLRGWLAERSRGWREVLEVMQAAGRGLAAAHAVGLVHRDIKPDNVMVGDDGRVRVMDFGLARRGTEGEGSLEASQHRRAMLAVEVTHAGTMLGTPAYMAPEQLRGEVVGPQADVFAFCVMLWEGLHGARPFAGTTLGELRANVEAGRIVAPARERRAPRWLDAVLVRGLAAAPGERWPGMSAVLVELGRGQARTRRRRALLLAGGLAAVAGGVYGGFAAAHQRTLAACDAEGAEVRDDWSEAARADVERAFTATGKANAATVLEKTTPWLDRWAASWQAARTQICVAHRVEGGLDDELHARAQDCLDERRGIFVALVRELAAADANTLTRATPAAAGLLTVEGCTDPATLRERPPLSPEKRTEVTAIRDQLARAFSLQNAGRFKEGLSIAREAATAAMAAGWPPVIAEAEYRVGNLESQLGDHAAAEQSLLRALAAAQQARAPRPALNSMTHLVFVVGDRGRRFAEGKVWAEAARTELMHVAGDVRPLQAQLDNNLALVHHARGAYDESRRLNERAVALWTEVYGEDHPQVAQGLNNLANAYGHLGESAESVRLHERALAIRERTLGEDHPFVAVSLSNMAIGLGKLGRPEEAIRVHERALALRERVLDGTNPVLVESLNNLADIQSSVGAYDEALRLFERALAILDATPDSDPIMTATILFNCGTIHHERRRDGDAARDHARSRELFAGALGEDHPTLAYPLDGLAQSRLRLGELDEALRLQQRALAVREAALGEDHPELLTSLIGLARVERARGRLDEALRLDVRALALAEATRGTDHPDLALALRDLGETHLAAGRPAEAIAPLERALTVVVPGDRSPEKRPMLRFLLARALWDAGVDRPRARGLAESAIEGFSAVAGRDPDVREIGAWLAAHRE